MLFFRERETEKERKRGQGGREGDTESKAGSRLWAVSTELDAGLELTNCEIMTQDEVSTWLTEPPGCPSELFSQYNFLMCKTKCIVYSHALD